MESPERLPDSITNSLIQTQENTDFHNPFGIPDFTSIASQNSLWKELDNFTFDKQDLNSGFSNNIFGYNQLFWNVENIKFDREINEYLLDISPVVNLDAAEDNTVIWMDNYLGIQFEDVNQVGGFANSGSTNQRQTRCRGGYTYIIF